MGQKLWIGVVVGMLACVAAYGCGDDDDGGAATGCPEDASAGAKFPCHCDDAGSGMATCKTDGTLGSCICEDSAGSGGTSGGSGNSTGSSGSGGSSAGSGGSSGKGGSGGSAGTTPEENDAGAEPPTSDAGMEPQNPAAPDDGNQLTPCNNDRDCNRDFGCYGSGQGGFCSAVCDQAEDCAALPGATYHCSQSGVCAVECANADDDASCPPGLQCVAVGGNGGQGGEGFRCLYAGEEPAPQGGPFAQCQSGGGGGGSSCMDGLQCIGGGGNGFCSHTCTPDNSDCSDVVAPSGTITASCVPQTPELGSCALDCEAAPDGCPEGMQCVTQGFYSVCRYMN